MASIAMTQPKSALSLRLTRRGRFVVFAIALCAVIFASWALVSSAIAQTTPAQDVPVYLVQPGDTLWGISLKLAPHEDPRIVVQEVAEANGISAGELQPGQQLVLPAKFATP